jgi:Ni/Co efflux regulator RcnB
LFTFQKQRQRKIKSPFNTRRHTMSLRVFVTSAVAATLALSSLSSFAQAYDKRGKVIIIQQQDDRHDNRRDNRQDERRADRRDDRQDERRSDWRDDRHDNRYYSHRRNDRRDQWRHERAEEQRRYYYGARGPEFVRGHVIPRDLRTPQYVVVDYRHHRLAPPPRGQQWVQVGADYVLVAVATGIIASIILNR